MPYAVFLLACIRFQPAESRHGKRRKNFEEALESTYGPTIAKSVNIRVRKGQRMELDHATGLAPVDGSGLPTRHYEKLLPTGLVPVEGKASFRKTFRSTAARAVGAGQQ